MYVHLTTWPKAPTRDGRTWTTQQTAKMPSKMPEPVKSNIVVDTDKCIRVYNDHLFSQVKPCGARRTPSALLAERQ